MINNGSGLKIFFCGFVLAGLSLLLSFSIFADPAEQGKIMDTSLLVDVEYVQDYIKQNPGLQLVDVRSEQAFEKLRIPGSIHVPLSLVRHKSLLNSGSVILLGSGSDPGSLLRVCRELRKSGVDASVLWGGLNRWCEAGGRLSGKQKDRNALNLVSPATYYRQKEQDYWQVLFLGEEQPAELEKTIPGAEFVPSTSELDSHLEKNQGQRLILLVTPHGRGYSRLETALHARNIYNVFWLKGGLANYDSHLRARKNADTGYKNNSKFRSECPDGPDFSIQESCPGCGN